MMLISNVAICKSDFLGDSRKKLYLVSFHSLFGLTLILADHQFDHCNSAGIRHINVVANFKMLHCLTLECYIVCLEHITL